MTYIKRAILALVLIAGFTPAIAQVPAAVPALPDTERRTSYSITASTCACAVNFALYGDGTDYQNWVEVFINGTRVNYNDASRGWTITSPSGSLTNLPRPITNAVLTFNAAQTGTVQIVGARRPRRASQFNEGAGVSARNFNQVLTDIISQNREIWDKTNDVTGRAIMAPPGETLNLLATAATRASSVLGFDALGNVTTFDPASAVTSSANVTFLPSGTGAASRTAQDKLREVVSIADYGGACDDATDNLAPFNKAQTYLATIGGGIVMFPSGKCRTSATLLVTNSNISIKGQGYGFGAGATILKPMFAGTDYVAFGSSVSITRNVGISNLAIIPGVTATAGSAIHVDGAGFVHIDKISIVSPFDGVSIDNYGNGTNVHINSVLMTNCAGSGMNFGRGGISLANEVFNTNISISGCLTGLNYVWADGIYNDAVSIYQSINSIKYAPLVGNGVSHVYYDKLIADSSSSTSVIYLATGGISGDHGYVNSAFNSNVTGMASSAGALVQGIAISNSHFENNTQSGMDFLSGSDISISNTIVGLNSVGSHGTYPGMRFRSGVTGVKISNTSSGAYGYLKGAGGTNYQSYGLVIDSGVTDYGWDSSFTTAGNVSGGISDAVGTPRALAVVNGGTGANTATGARTNLGLAIGTNVEAWSANLDTYAGKAPPTGAVVGTTDTQTLTNKGIDTAGPNTIKVAGVDVSTAWTAYTPTVSASAGTITTASATGRYKTIGKTTFVEMTLTITTNGTGATYLLATLPNTAQSSAVLNGRENVNTGLQLQGLVTGASNSLQIADRSNAYPATNGSVVIMSGVYENQ